MVNSTSSGSTPNRAGANARQNNSPAPINQTNNKNDQAQEAQHSLRSADPDTVNYLIDLASHPNTDQFPALDSILFFRMSEQPNAEQILDKINELAQRNPLAPEDEQLGDPSTRLTLSESAADLLKRNPEDLPTGDQLAAQLIETLEQKGHHHTPKLEPLIHRIANTASNLQQQYIENCLITDIKNDLLEINYKAFTKGFIWHKTLNAAISATLQLAQYRDIHNLFPTDELLEIIHESVKEVPGYHKYYFPAKDRALEDQYRSTSGDLYYIYPNGIDLSDKKSLFMEQGLRHSGKTIGSGAFGTVSLAFNITQGKFEVAKTLTGKNSLKDFQNENRALEKIKGTPAENFFITASAYAKRALSNGEKEYIIFMPHAGESVGSGFIDTIQSLSTRCFSA